MCRVSICDCMGFCSWRMFFFFKDVCTMDVCEAEVGSLAHVRLEDAATDEKGRRMRGQVTACRVSICQQTKRKI